MKRLTTYLLTLLLSFVVSGAFAAGITSAVQPDDDDEGTLGPSPMEYVTHYDEATFSHWSIAGNSDGSFQLNTWSGESDASGMSTPFIEYWVGSGNTLTDATISHKTLVGLPEGTYNVQIFARAFNEKSTTAVSEGIKFTANGRSVDLTTGTKATYVDGSNQSAEVYGTYTLSCYVGSDGLLDVGFTVQGLTACDWVAFKNLFVTFLTSTGNQPELVAIEGKMSAEAKSAMDAAIATYNADRSEENFWTAIDAIQDAQASIDEYAEVAALVDALDDSGLAVWNETESGIAYNAGTLAADADITADMVAAQKAQTTSGSDMTYVVLYDGSWTGDTGTYADGVERYQTANFTAEDGDVLYKTIEGLAQGYYYLTFYAAPNSTSGRDFDNIYGAGIAQAFANSDAVDVEVLDQTACTPSDYSYTFNCYVEDNGVLRFGLRNVGTGGNWYVCQEVSLTIDVIATVGPDPGPVVPDPEPADIEGDFIIMQDGLYFGTSLTDGRQATLLRKPMYVGFEKGTGSHEGTYRLDPYEYNSDDSGQHYFGYSSTIDGVCSFAGSTIYWEVEQQSDGTFTIYSVTSNHTGYLTSNGEQQLLTLDSTPSAGSYWTLLTKEDVIASMENATSAQPVDATALINFPDFKRHSNDGTVKPWTVTGTVAIGIDGNGSYTGNAAEAYHNAFSVTQTITLPLAGTYTLSAQGFHRDDNSLSSYTIPVLFAGNQTMELMNLNEATGETSVKTSTNQTISDAYADFLSELYPVGPITITAETDGETIDIGFSGTDANQWVCFSELTLLYYGPDHETLHDCVAELDHWTTTGNNGSHELNTWSAEADESGMLTPFLQNWVASGSTLTDATISHNTLTDLEEGYYSVTLDTRIFSEAGNAITEGTTFNANGESLDLLEAGTAGTYGSETEVYGTYTLLAYVTEGTLDINLHITNATYNWLAWKNLKVDFYGTEMPTLAVVSGVMNVDVEAAMNAAVDAYNAAPSTASYSQAVAAINAAKASVEYYAPIVTAVNGLDSKGAAVWAESQYAPMLDARTLTNEDVGVDLAAAQIVQTTDGSDMTYVAKYGGTWKAEQGNGPGTCPSLSTATETYNDSDYEAGAVLCKHIEGLVEGTYTVSFYAQANAANISGLASGDGIAQVYANGVSQDITVGTLTNLNNEWPDGSLHTFTCAVRDNGVLEFGLQNVAAGGNWYVAEGVAMTLVERNEGVKGDYEFINEEWLSLDLSRVDDADITYQLNDNTITVSASGQNNVALGNSLSHSADGTITTADYTVGIDQYWFIVVGTNLSYAAGDSYLWWMNGTNKNTQVAPTYCGVLSDGQVLFAWNLTNSGIDDNLQSNLNYLDGLTGFGLTSTTGTSVISDISFYTWYDALEAYPELSDISTGISAVATTTVQQETIYTLSGVRMNKVTKGGVYIINGKKVLVK